MEPIDVAFQIVVTAPVPGVLAALQCGQGSAAKNDQTQRTTDADLTFGFTLRLGPGKDGVQRWSGSALQKDSRGAFVYVRWGRSAGDVTTEIDRRAKIYLHGVTLKAAQKAAKTGKPIQLVIGGKAKDGWPACATVPVVVKHD